MFTKFRIALNHRVDHLVLRHLTDREWFRTKLYVWLFRLGHWAGFHDVAFYAPEDSDTVQGITFGTPEYVNQVVEAHEAMFGQTEGQDDG